MKISKNTTASRAWSGNTVAHIIEKPEYMGHTVNFRTYKDSYKDKKAKEAPKEGWMIFENTHPAIIGPGTWETTKARKRSLNKEQKRIAELNSIIKKLYEDNVTGRLTDKRFELLCAEYEIEQSELEQSVQKLQAEIDSFNADGILHLSVQKKTAGERLLASHKTTMLSLSHVFFYFIGSYFSHFCILVFFILFNRKNRDLAYTGLILVLY